MNKKSSLQNSVSFDFKALRWRLLWSYLIVMIAIRVVSNVVVYKFFAHSIYQQLDNRLVNLADAAAHSIEAIQQDIQAVNQTIHRPMDGDGDLDIPWQNLRQPDQSVEWFDLDKRLLAVSGTLSLTTPLTEGFHTVNRGKIRTLTIPAYGYNHHHEQLQGYIRVAESTKSVETVLTQLHWGSTLGGIIALGLTGVGGMWLTQQSLKPIERSYGQLKQFTADASHELRSPITVIKTAVDVLQTHPERIHVEDVETLKAIASATQQMNCLVEDLLLLARTDNVTAAPTQEWILIPLDELLEDVLEFLEFDAQAKEITMTYEWHSVVSVSGSALQLFRLFRNLLENALQYTPSGGSVNVSMFDDDKFVVVSVEDSGIGIAPEHLPLVFDRLWRADRARNYRDNGSGLGLAIAQAVARHHGGDITVSSQLGVGSCFRVCLPIAS